MEAAQNRRRDDSMAIGQVVGWSTPRLDQAEDPEAQAAMWAAAIVMRHPSSQNVAEMSLVQRD
jgi:hypothetical protein